MRLLATADASAAGSVQRFDKGPHLLYINRMKEIIPIASVLLFAFTSASFSAPSAPVVVVETSAGTIELNLYSDIAPKACENMTRLAEKGYYNGTIFHRVIDGFMIQGGDPTGTGTGGKSIWRESFEDEFSKKARFDKAGLVAMANAGPGTNGSQFFITLAPTPHLNDHHTIFGEVVAGYDVVQKIGRTPVDGDDRPVTEQKILRMYLKK